MMKGEIFLDGNWVKLISVYFLNKIEIFSTVLLEVSSSRRADRGLVWYTKSEM